MIVGMRVISTVQYDTRTRTVQYCTRKMNLSKYEYNNRISLILSEFRCGGANFSDGTNGTNFSDGTNFSASIIMRLPYSIVTVQPQTVFAIYHLFTGDNHLILVL